MLFITHNVKWFIKGILAMGFWILALLAFITLLKAQPSVYPFFASAPTPVNTGSVTRVGNAGNQTYFYYIIAKYPIGNAVRSAPFAIIDAPATLSGTNYVRVSWNGIIGATGYDVLRLNTSIFPQNGTCLNCFIVSNTTANTINDQSNGTLGNYSLSQAPSASVNIYLDNVTQTTPTVFVDSPVNSTFKMARLMAFDASIGRMTKPNRTGTVIPTTCSTSETFFLTTTNTLYGCGPDNVMTALGTAGASITQLIGDVTGIGPGVANTVLANSGVVAGSCDTSINTCLFTVDAKGRVTAIGVGGLTSGFCVVNITAPTVVTFGANVNGVNTCNLQVGNKVYLFSAPATYTISANGGTGFLYLSSAGVLTMGYGGGTFAGGNVVAAGAGSAATFPITSPPVDAFTIATFTAAAGIWTAKTNTKSEGGAMPKFTAGANMSITVLSDEIQFASTAGFTGTYVGDATFGANGHAIIGQHGAGGGNVQLNTGGNNPTDLGAFDVGGIPTARIYGNADPGNGLVFWPEYSFMQTKKVWTVGTLPMACNATSEGSHASVSDLLAPTFLGAAVGGGAVHGAVYCDGTSWKTD